MILAMASQAGLCRCSNFPPDFNKPRRKRTLSKEDPLMNREERQVFFWQPYVREFNEKGGRALLHASWLMANENKFALTNRIIDAANEFQRNNKEEALYQKPVLRAMADEINKQYRHLSDKLVTDAYNEDVVEYNQYINSPLEDPEEVIEIPGPRAVNSWNWCEKTDWKKGCGDPGWVTHMKRKDIVWMPVNDKTVYYRPGL